MSDSPGARDLGEYLAQYVADHIESDQLPQHWTNCLGCGNDNAAGFHLQVRRDGDDVVARHTFAERHTGAPGIAHGGAVATVVDDVLGFLLYVARTAGVTRHLAVDYLRPVLIGVPYDIRARIDSRDGRKLWVSGVGTAPDGTPTFTATALFITVTLEHFRVATGEQPPVTP